ncbi:hypothetical protein BOX15_Mlig015936g7, partial [Macrostomum lignano]
QAGQPAVMRSSIRNILSLNTTKLSIRRCLATTDASAASSSSSCSTSLPSAVAAGSFRFADLSIERTEQPKPKPPNDSLVFGSQFSDHMLLARHSKSAAGWMAPRIQPLQSLPLHPASKCLHYALECFEGLKAFRGVDGRVRLFRPMENCKRMLRSAERSTLASFDPAELHRCLRELIRLDADWVPDSRDCSLYIRPTMIAAEPRISVGPAEETLLYVITGPVGPYYPTGFKPVTLLADPTYCRAWPGGVGNNKMGANYGPTCYVQLQAAAQGCQQVLWLYGPEHRLTEVGTMNLFIFWRSKDTGKPQLVTPPLNSGLILPGIVRDSLLRLAREWNEWEVLERDITMGELIEAIDSGRLMEMFGSGTACIVSPVSGIKYDGKVIQVPTMSQGAPVTMRFFKTLTDIQYGRIKDHPWAEIVA